MITSKDKRWISIAKKMMVHSQSPCYRMAALVVSGGRLIKVGLNSPGPAAAFAKFPKDRSRHAEIEAIMMLSKKETKGCTIYISGVSVGGNTILSRSCTYCYNVLRKAGVRRIVYHSRTGELREEKI